MIQDEQIVSLINLILSSGENNDQRRVNETKFSELRDTYPNEFITSLLNLCKHPDLSIRQFSSVHLRNCTSTFTPKNFKNVWPQLNPQVQEYVKSQLFVLLQEETSQNVRNQICDCIGEVGGSLYEDETKNQWPGLLQQLWQLFLSPRNDLIECGFKILGNLFQYAIELFDKHTADIGALFNQGLLNGDVRIRTADLQAIGYFVTCSEYKKYKLFEDLVPVMIQATYEILLQNEELGEEALEVFSDIVESEYKFLRKHFLVFFNGICQIFREKKIDQGVKRIGTEALLILCEKSPKLFKNEKSTIVQLVEMVFFHMIQISEDISDSWKKPAEGFNDDIEQDEDCETARFGMSSIDRLIECIGEKEMLPILSQIVQQLFQHQDWRYKYAAIMALSQVGEYIEEIDEIRPIVDKVMGMLNDGNPMIRYAVCHAIGQIADDMKPKFQESFLNSILPAMILRLQTDDVPRVVSHILACLTNFVEGTEKGFKGYLEQLITISIQFLQNGISIVKENAMSVLAASAEASQQDFVPYVSAIMPILFSTFEQHSKKEYKQLKGQTIEAITLIANAVKKDVFAPYLDATINMLLLVQEGTFETVDPQKSYVLSGWQRLCLVCPDLLGPYLNRIVPSLFKLVKVVFDTEQGAQGDTYHTYDNEEAEIAINMLSVFIEELKELFFPYFDTCTQLIVPLCSFTTDESIRRAAARCLVSLIQNVNQNVKSTGLNAPLIQGAKYFLGVLLESAQKEFDPEVIIDQVDCMKEIIDTVSVNFMTPQELNELSDKVIKLLFESDQRKAENENIIKDEDCDEDEQSMIKEENETEEELHVKIAEFIGILFKTHSQQVAPLCELIYTQVLPKVLDPNLTPKMHQFGIFLIDDIIEHLGYNIAGAKFGDLANALALYALDKVLFVRQAATYGIGILALNTPKEFYPQFAGKLIEAIAKSLQIQKTENDNDKVYGNCRDNSIAALGKIIKSQPESLGLELTGALNQWLYFLPLKFDKPEARIQHSFLAELIQTNGVQVIANKLENAAQVLKIFVEVYNTKKSDTETDSKILKALSAFEQIDLVKQNWNTIYGQLNPENQKKIQEMAQTASKGI